jgi:hypothetical protein
VRVHEQAQDLDLAAHCRKPAAATQNRGAAALFDIFVFRCGAAAACRPACRILILQCTLHDTAQKISKKTRAEV